MTLLSVQSRKCTGRRGGQEEEEEGVVVVVKNKEWKGKQEMKLEEDRGTLKFSTGYRKRSVSLREAWNESRSLERNSD